MTFSQRLKRLSFSSLLFAGLIAVTTTTQAIADTPQAKPTAQLDSSIVTISSHGYAQVDATYKFHLNKGANSVVLDKLPSQLVTSSVKTDRFNGDVLLGPISYREANLNAEAIEAALLNKEVTLVVPGARADQPQEITGKLLSFDGSTAVIKDKDDYVRKVPSVQGWKCKPLPTGLNNTPSLTVTLDTEEAGDYIGIIRFRTRGVGYSTSHTWEYNEKAGTIDWATDVLVKNQSGATLSNVELNVAAGDTGADEADMAGDMNIAAAAPAALEAAPGGGANFRVASVNQAEVEDLAGIQIFSVPGKATLVKGVEQLIPFYRSTGSIPVKRENRIHSTAWYARGGSGDAKVATILTFTNNKKSGLGLPIPRGPVSVQARNQRGTLMTVGGTNVSDVALEQEVASEIGSDWNLKAKHKVADYSTSKPVVVTAPEGNPTVTAEGKPIRYLEVIHTWNLVTEVKNGKDRDVDVVVEEFANNIYQLQNGNHGFKFVRAGLWEAKISVPAGKSTEIHYTVKRTEIIRRVVNQ